MGNIESILQEHRVFPPRAEFVKQANVSYEHPFHMPWEYALNIDFVDESQGPGARVAVELSAEAGRALAEAILAVLQRAEAGGYIDLQGKI